MTTYRGPAATLSIDGKEIHRGDECTLSESAQRALERAGHRFKPMLTGPGAQSASKNLADAGTTAEKQARASGISKA